MEIKVLKIGHNKSVSTNEKKGEEDRVWYHLPFCSTQGMNEVDTEHQCV